MDKSWINKPPLSKVYREGVRSFINFAKQNSPTSNLILCPCEVCTNCHLLTCDEVEQHLVCNGFLQGYIHWFCHGESPTLSSFDQFLVQHESSSQMASELHDNSKNDHDEMQALVHDALGIHDFPIDVSNLMDQQDDDGEYASDLDGMTEGERTETFNQLMEDVNTPLYLGCKNFSKFSFIVRLFQMKCLNGWSGKSFTMLLELLNEAFPEIKIPASTYATKKFLKSFGLGYQKIAACPNDCMLFRGDKENLESCEVCGTSKWSQTLNESQQLEESSKTTRKRKLAKILRYFPLVPRLQRLFMSSKTSSYMRWHDEGRTKDGKLRHPADGEAWKKFDQRYPDFASDSRNVRLGLASDGFNPFRQMSSVYSIWPVVLIIYNLPPWSCMKQSSFILSMIIPGPKSPGNDIDIYLQPLIDELKKLWDGVPTYDATAKETFILRANLMWTISDLPGYAILFGYSTKGCKGCPCCADQTVSRWLYNGKKLCYMGHRRWLELNHKYRLEAQSFDGTEELRHAPTRLSGSDVLKQLEGLSFRYGKKPQASKKGKKRARQEDADVDYEEVCDDLAVAGSWKKKSIFFELPYWEFNLLRHNIDVMHVGKNIGENCLGTLLDIEGKTKDNIKARLDLVEMGIRHQLHPDGTNLPPACYSMSKDEKDLFCKVLKDLRVPDGYASNISRSVNSKGNKLQSLKSHDYHILMEDLLPVALRASMCEQVTSVLVELCSIYKGLCSKVLCIEELDKLQHRASLTLCQMETIFPPSFFTIMVHLVIHLAEEAKLGGPVQCRWMYPIERLWYSCKNFVGNTAHPEGSITEGYLSEECSNFCSRYLEGVETRLNRPRRNPEFSNLEGAKYLFDGAGKTIGKVDAFELDDMTWQQAHRYVLDHHESIESFRNEYLREIKRRRRPSKLKAHEQNKLMHEQFHKWFDTYVSSLDEQQVSPEIRILAKGPQKIVKRYNGYIFNGFRFRTKNNEVMRKTQNSGVVVTSKTRSYASSKDNNPIDGDVEYYGILTDIIDLDYYGHFRVVLFRCDWADVIRARGIEKDKYGFTVVNFSHLIHTGELISHEPFVFPSQVQQVFYVKDPSASNSYVALKMAPRDIVGIE